MPLKQPPKVFQILAKTHKLTVFLNAPHPTTIAALKTQALAALLQFSDTTDDVPKARGVDDFEFCSATKQQGKIVAFDVLDTHAIVRDTLSNWEAIYFRFRNEHGKLQDVNVEQPVDDEEEQEVPPDVKGKRKAPPT